MAPVVHDELTDLPCPECGEPLRFEVDADDNEWLVCDSCGYTELLKSSSVQSPAPKQSITEEQFTCRDCRFHLPQGGCTKPYDPRLPCPYGQPKSQVPPLYHRPKRTVQTTLTEADG